MKSALIWLLLLCNLGFGPAEQVNDPNIPVQDPIEWQAPSSAVEEPITSEWLEENLEHVTLEIYYMSPRMSTRAPVSVNDLKRWSDVHVTVDLETLSQHKDLLAQMLDTPIAALDGKDGGLDTRIYYALCDDTGKVLFDVAMWWWSGENEELLVNGTPCKEEDVFYDVALAFLPPDAASDLEDYLKECHGF